MKLTKSQKEAIANKIVRLQDKKLDDLREFYKNHIDVKEFIDILKEYHKEWDKLTRKWDRLAKKSNLCIKSINYYLHLNSKDFIDSIINSTIINSTIYKQRGHYSNIYDDIEIATIDTKEFDTEKFIKNYMDKWQIL